jgi:hypothetical protein
VGLGHEGGEAKPGIGRSRLVSTECVGTGLRPVQAEQRLAGVVLLDELLPNMPLSFTQPDSQGGCPHVGRYAGKSMSILAAMMKSLCVSPSILCVHMVISALPHVSRMSG